jgi:hypothetical protein
MKAWEGHAMTRKAQKRTALVPAKVHEMSGSDRQALTEAYKTGLITGWKRDGDGGYRVMHGGWRDDYVAATDLGSYLEKVRKGK